MSATPAQIAAAWRVFRGERKGFLLGPGPGFAEAIEAALALGPLAGRVAALEAEVERLRRDATPIPVEIMALLPDIAEGEVRALPFLYDRGPPGPDWFLAGGGPIPGNMGGDFDESDAKFAAFAWNRVRAEADMQAAGAEPTPP